MTNGAQITQTNEETMAKKTPRKIVNPTPKPEPFPDPTPPPPKDP